MKIRPSRVRRRPSLLPSLEPLEARIAPALLVSMASTDIVAQEQTAGNDNVTLTVDAANFHFFDPNGITAGNGATQVDANHVDIPSVSFAGKITIDTGVGNDAVFLTPGLPTLAGLEVRTGAINPGIPFPDITTNGGSITLSSAFPLSINSVLSETGGGDISITAPGMSLDPGGKLTTTTGFVLLTLDSLTIDPAAAIQAGGANGVVFTTLGIHKTIDIGGKDGPSTLGLSAAELANVNAAAIEISTENGPIVVSDAISRISPTDFFIHAGGPNNLTFKGGGMIDTAGGTADLGARGIIGGTASNDLVATAVTFNNGQNGIGTSTNPFSINAVSLDVNSFGEAVKVFIRSDVGINLNSLNAAGALVTLSGGPYVATATQMMGEVVLTLNNATLDLNDHAQIVSGLNGSGTLTNSGATTPQFDFSSDAPNSLFTGVISGNITLLKDGPGNQRLTGANTFVGPITISSGALQINSDAALGDATNTVTIDGGELQTTGNFTIARDITAAGATGNPTLDVHSGNLTLTGTITGNLQKTGAGNLLFGTNFLGQAPVAANNVAVTVGDTTVKLGGTGNVILTIVPDPINGGTRISQIELQDTHANSVLNIKGPTDGTTTTVDKIMSMDPADAVGTIKLGASVVLGDGMNDTTPDLDIEGSIKKLLLNDVSAYTLFNLGKGLAYLDTYKNHPQLNLHNVMGPGVVIDATGDGMTPAGTGGGGLGKVVVNQWSDPGIIQTTQSVTSFQVKSGDCNVVFMLDPNHLGEATTANIGQMSVINGAWGSSGSVIEGTVGSFSAADFLAAADITAASMGKLTVKSGDYAGTTTLTDPSGKKMSTFSVNGNYLGLVSSAEGIVNINVKGEFKGSLSAAFMGSISAYSFDGTGANPGDHQQIIATNGSLGTLKTSLRGIQNFEIDAATVFNGFNINWPSAPTGAVGIDNVTVAAGQIDHVDVTMKPASGAIVTGIQNSTFESASSIGEVTSKGTVTGSLFAGVTKIGNIVIKGDLTGSKLLAGVSLGGDGMLGGMADQFTPGGTIGNVTVSGTFATTTIAAGVDPGMDLTYGNGDTVGTSGLVAGPSKIGALVFGALSGAVGASSGDPHSDAIEAASIKSLKVGSAKAITTFTTPQYLDAGGDGESLSDVLVKLIS